MLMANLVNRLRSFGLAAFENCSIQLQHPMMLNLSYNNLEFLQAAPAARIFVPPFIHVSLKHATLSARYFERTLF